MRTVEKNSLHWILISVLMLEKSKCISKNSFSWISSVDYVDPVHSVLFSVMCIILLQVNLVYGRTGLVLQLLLTILVKFTHIKLVYVLHRIFLEEILYLQIVQLSR